MVLFSSVVYFQHTPSSKRTLSSKKKTNHIQFIIFKFLNIRWIDENSCIFAIRNQKLFKNGARILLCGLFETVSVLEEGA